MFTETLLLTWVCHCWSHILVQCRQWLLFVLTNQRSFIQPAVCIKDFRKNLLAQEKKVLADDY